MWYQDGIRRESLIAALDEAIGIVADSYPSDAKGKQTKTYELAKLRWQKHWFNVWWYRHTTPETDLVQIPKFNGSFKERP